MTICNTDLPKRRLMTAYTGASKQRRRTVSDDDVTDNISVPTFHLAKPKRKVQFSSHSSLMLYNGTHQQDYDDEDEQVSSWYTRDEEKQFKQLAKCEIQLLRRTTAAGVSNMNNNYELSPVGLERSLISDEYTLRRANSRRLVSRAVFREQARQYQRLSCRQQYPDMTEVIAWDDECIESIAKHARHASEWSRAQAQVIGYFQAITNYPQLLSTSENEDKQEEGATETTKEELVGQCKKLEHFVKAPRRVSERDLLSY
jgi:hypothetical protein